MLRTSLPKLGTANSVVSLFPPLPLARELKVVLKRTRLPCASGLRLRRSPGSADCPERFGTAARPSHPVIESVRIRCAGQWHAPKTFPPYSRAAATDFHRLPVRGVSCDCGRRSAMAERAPLAKAAERPREFVRCKLNPCSAIPSQNHPRAPARPHLHFERRLETPLRAARGHRPPRAFPRASICPCAAARCGRKTPQPSSARGSPPARCSGFRPPIAAAAAAIPPCPPMSRCCVGSSSSSSDGCCASARARITRCFSPPES